MQNKIEYIKTEKIIELHSKSCNHRSYMPSNHFQSICSEEILNIVSKCLYLNKIKNNIFL